EDRGRRGSVVADLGAALADGGFVKTLLLGIVGKFVFAGIAMFAVPLILYQRGYAKDDIGQVMMIYSLSVLAATVLATRVADRRLGAGPVRAAGALVAGLGILLRGLVTETGSGPLAAWVSRWAGWPDLATLVPPTSVTGALLVVLGVVTIGAAQGMLAAPAIA